MAMAATRVVELCSRSAAALREDMALLENGAFNYRSLIGVDVTNAQLARMRAIVSHLQEIIDSCGCDCS